MMGVGNFTEQYEQKGEEDCEGCDGAPFRVCVLSQQTRSCSLALQRM